MLDKTKALDELQISEEEYNELLIAFVELASEQLEQLEAAASGGNDTETREVAHSLKGAAGNLRLDDCAAIAEALERASRESRKDDVRAQLDALVAAVDELRTSGG
jgi:HPt (histidine-containing phosphotransfer) domain-containing protein